MPPPETLATALRVLPILVLIRCVCLQLFNLYGDLWLYVGIPELGSIVLSTALGSAVFWALLQWPAAFPAYPTSLVTLDGLLCIIALSALRVARRVHRSLRCRVQHPRRVLVVGVDDSAERTLRELAVHPRFDYRIVGMVGENRASYGLRIHNVPVVGCCDELPEILRAENPDEVFVIASATWTSC